MEHVIRAIGIYHSEAVNAYDVGRQPREDDSRVGEIILEEGHNFEQALTELSGFERIWIIFQFHRNENWKPMVQPPRGIDRKVGVFATRAPYRPNALGISCVRLISVQGRKLRVEGADLLDGTPVFDLKPYVPESDAFPNSRAGWLEGIEQQKYNLSWSDEARRRLEFLNQAGVTQIESFAIQQLEYDPFATDRKRVWMTENPDEWALAYRTWRLHFRQTSSNELEILSVESGYSEQDLLSEDRWQDHELHRRFRYAVPFFHADASKNEKP